MENVGDMKKEIEKNIKILAVDDHHATCDGIKSFFSKTREIRVAGIAHNGLEAVQKTGEILPDIILMDVEMPFLNGIEATKRILKEFPHTKILMFSAYPSPIYVKQSLEAGARGYAIKDSSLKELARAIKKIMKGQIYLWDNLPATEENIALGFESFTNRETEILNWMFLCKSPSQIAKKMHITLSTLHTYKTTMRKKVKALNDMELVMLALKHRYLTLDRFNITY